MKGGGLFNSVSSLATGFAKDKLQEAKNSAKDKVQGAVTDAVSSDAAKSILSKAQGAANSVGLGSQFTALKDKVAGEIEKRTGLSLSSPGPTGCPIDRIDVPTVSDVLIATADNPYTPITFMDKYFSYVVVDSRNPPPTETTNKTTLWYISIANAALLITFGTLYGTLS